MTFGAGVGSLLAVYNNATNLLGLPRAAYVPANLTATAVLVAAARSHGYDSLAIGLSRSQVGPGLRWGGAGAAAVALGLVTALRWPPATPFLHDARVAGLSPRDVVFDVGIRIPLGTVLFEELAFRGVLLGAWGRERSVPAAIAASSAIFGLWHIGPTIVLLAENDVALSPGGRALAVGGSVVATAAAGAVFAALRLRTGGILAPALVHLATNVLGTLAAYHAQRVCPQPQRA